MQFVHITSDHPAYSRVIVSQMEQTLSRKMIGEIRLFTPAFEFELPANLYLDGISPTSRIEESRIWDGFTFQSFGDPSSLEPIISSNPTSAHNSNRSTVMDQDEERITAWTSKIVKGANPDIAPEAPVEPVQLTRRRVLVDSDSEYDEPSGQIPQSQTVGSPVTTSAPGLEDLRGESPEPSSDLVSLLSSPDRSVSKKVIGSMPVEDKKIGGFSKVIPPPPGFQILSSAISESSADLVSLISSFPGRDGQSKATTAPPGLQPPQNVNPELPSDLVSLLSTASLSATKQAAGSMVALEPADRTLMEASAQLDVDLLSSSLPKLQIAVEDVQSLAQVSTGAKPPHTSSHIVPDQPHQISSIQRSSRRLPHTTSMQPSASSTAPMADSKSGKPSQPVLPMPPLSGPSTPPRPYAPDSSSPRPKFDPKAYGEPSPKLRRGQTVHPGGRSGSNSHVSRHSRGSRGQSGSISYAQATTSGQQPVPRGNHPEGGSNIHHSPAVRGLFRGRGRGGLGGSPQAQPNDLVDTSEPASNARPRIPPGFGSHVPLVRAPTPQRSQSQTPNIMDEPIQSGVSAPHSQSGASHPETRASRESRIRFSDEGADYQATYIPKRNFTSLRENSLRAALEATEKQHAQGSGIKKAKEEEKPPVHSTMRQQGKNPGKQPVKQESKAEAAARRAKVLLDAHGPVPVKAPSKPQPPSAQTEPMSKWKKKEIRKNATVADGHPELVEDITRKNQCDNLIPQLETLFETCRAFNGRVSFEVAFGQVLIFPSPQLPDEQNHNVNDWEALFDPKPNKVPCSTTFSKILTTNGADIDRALELKGPSANANMKLWEPCPAHQSVSYEFACQSRSNEDFLILVDSSGNHELRKGLVTVGMVNLHVPAQVWDASAILSGHLKWFEPPEVLKNSAATFLKSLYIVPDREKLMIVFRQPSDHEVQVRNLIVKRVSYHACNLPGYEDIQLKVVESKSLKFKVHSEDKKLWQGYEGAKEEYEQVARNGRVHYEMSIVHRGINQVLALNEELEIGELTPAEATGRSLVGRDAIRSMLDIAVHMISKIDFVGMHNFGTQLRLDAEAEQKRRQLEASLGPQGKSILQTSTRIGVAPVSRVHHGSLVSSRPLNGGAGTGAGVGSGGLGGTGGGGGGGGSPVATTARPPVHGVRMNTLAEVYEDPEDGSHYMLGMGGARIPVAGVPQPSASTVLPDDSASQVGGRPPGFVTPWSNDAARDEGFW